MTNKPEATIRNFTPVLDEIVKEYGLVTAAVWGRVWRYTQMENHVCQAATEKIASELNLGRRTIIRHLEILTQNGYLKDHTPDLRNRPHTYSITQKARILITIEGIIDNKKGVPESHTGVPESHTKTDGGVSESTNRCATESHEETIKKGSNTKGNGINLQAIMLGALSEVTKNDYHIKRNAGRLAKPASELIEAGYTPEQVLKFYGMGGWWYRHDWRGKKNQAPTPGQVLETIQQASTYKSVMDEVFTEEHK